ncbi:MAG: hypothetical protein IGS54_16940 [Elainella sp. C42_A2020_010]|nr:hypothetical protein [Elainella sp. C42_A2020_010]
MPKPERPKPRHDQHPVQKNQGKPQKTGKGKDKEPLDPRLGDAADVPVMFRAQIEQAHGSLQFAGKVKDSSGKESREDVAKNWVEEWLEPWQVAKPSTQQAELAKNQLSVALQRFKPSEPDYQLKMPTWTRDVGVWIYQLSWRLVTNSGQEPDLIRPVLGAKGVPYYPGSSMKGAFAQACGKDEIGNQKRLLYCGGETEENGVSKLQPGLLRFHGGYPVDATWADERTLVDVIHPQQSRQVEQEEATGAKKQISLYKTAICFRISSTKPDEIDWEEVRVIWEKALASGLGGRTSAAYGQVAYRIEGKTKIPLSTVKQPLLSVYLSGQGITSTLLNRKPEFRPNMFKAALRGHTLRLFAGVTDGKNAKRATASLWGDTDKEVVGKGAIVGQLGIQFLLEPGVSQLSHPKHSYRETDLYRLTDGRLDLYCQAVKESLPESEIEDFVKNLLHFTLLLGGFGKSWRRVDHNKFSHQIYLPNYFKYKDKAPIGCHWEFGKKSHDLYIDTSDWHNTIPLFLNTLHQQVQHWLVNWNLPRNGYEKTWRESWHPENVQVWGRLADGEKDSLAIAWFHKDYIAGKTIKGTFAGKISQIGRVWHRMYPQYMQVNGEWQTTGKYVELLTLFPRYENANEIGKKNAEEFVQFLQQNQDFAKLWGI